LQANFKPLVVWLILNGKAEEALALLAKNYRVNTPKPKIGLPKGRKTNVSGCYTPKNETISLLNSDVMGNPFVILHEFYHHLRTSVDKKHKGTEKTRTNSQWNSLKRTNRQAPTKANTRTRLLNP
jgi:hypothetical protein